MKKTLSNKFMIMNKMIFLNLFYWFNISRNLLNIDLVKF